MSTAPPPVLPEIRRYPAKHVPYVPTDARLRKHAVPLDDRLLGAYQLPRGSVFLADPDVTEPFLFTANITLPGTNAYGGRAYVVIARELGDLEWPAFLLEQRRMVHGDHARNVKRVLGDVKERLNSFVPYARGRFA